MPSQYQQVCFFGGAVPKAVLLMFLHTRRSVIGFLVIVTCFKRVIRELRGGVCGRELSCFEGEQPGGSGADTSRLPSCTSSKCICVSTSWYNTCQSVPHHLRCLSRRSCRYWDSCLGLFHAITYHLRSASPPLSHITINSVVRQHEGLPPLSSILIRNRGAGYCQNVLGRKLPTGSMSMLSCYPLHGPRIGIA